MSDIPEILRPMRHFLAIRDFEPPFVEALVEFSRQRKEAFLGGRLQPRFQGKILAMIFQKSSLRTRMGFEAAMAQLGGHAINLEDHQIGISRREAVKDVARVLSGMCNVIMARTYAHQAVIELSMHARVPVINGLSDWSHPCQALADLLSLLEHFGRLPGLKVAYIGDANNVARSLLNACCKVGCSFRIASPPKYQMADAELAYARGIATRTGAEVLATVKPEEAVAGADAIYTDVWTSMGQEAEQAEREKAFAPYQINAELLAKASPQAVVMHCLPAHRGLEITDEVLDSPQAIVFQQAENRLHTQRALLEILLQRPAEARALA